MEVWVKINQNKLIKPAVLRQVMESGWSGFISIL